MQEYRVNLEEIKNSETYKQARINTGTTIYENKKQTKHSASR
jgi:hypothetical protein